MKNLIKSRLEKRTNEQLMNDTRVAMDSNDEGSNLIFVLALNILEDRLTNEEYVLFEESL